MKATRQSLLCSAVLLFAMASGRAEDSFPPPPAHLTHSTQAEKARTAQAEAKLEKANARIKALEASLAETQKQAGASGGKDEIISDLKKKLAQAERQAGELRAEKQSLEKQLAAEKAKPARIEKVVKEVVKPDPATEKALAEANKTIKALEVKLAEAGRASARQADAAGPKGDVGLKPDPQPLSLFKDCADCPDLVVIPGGSFSMGSPDNEKGRDGDEGPVQRVSVRSFALAKTELTTGHYLACVDAGGCKPPQWLEVGSEYNIRTGKNDYYKKFTGNDQPIVGVSWDNAREYVNWLSQKTGKTYRLPSEAEWEYAARAGTSTRFHTGDCLSTDQANYDGNYPASGCPKGQYRQKILPVASLAKNAFGLYDMHGNVWEWVQDCKQPNYNGAPTDGTVWEVDCTGVGRGVRGGSWYNDGRYARSANRNDLAPENRSVNLGFRPARTLP